eukprot:TRINITY_DN3408_c0_g1_i1.p2 TRINITY_DN3408_c0_g1~~TRINITY_DN3408_c0_g1_i1.p2  ORF type:complete len:268 (+),score=16.90 TRINITY_DN3408_c0_g1_i1:435-1238(+)
MEIPKIKGNLQLCQQLDGDIDESPNKLTQSLSLHQSQKFDQAQALQSIGQISSFLQVYTLKFPEPDVDKTFQEIIQIFEDPALTWTKVVKNKQIEIHKRKTPDNPAVLIKAVAFIEAISCQKIYNMIYDTNTRVTWDPVCADFQVIETIDDFNDVIYYRLVTPFGVSRRDFLQKRSYRFSYPNPESIIISFKSIEHEKCPQKPGIIRCDTLIAGYLLHPDPTNPKNSILKICSQCDIKGIVPKFIVNSVASKAPVDWVNKMKKACKT